MEKFPATSLLDWYDHEKRDLPWRDTESPYHIWVSEIMLQQTRVDTVIPYYHRFIRTFPKIEDLASADLQEVLKLWEGLGYYTRARNFHKAAKTVVNENGGALPDTYEDISRLPGIGPYTASALLSIIFNKPHPVVDGNVIRVITRYFGIDKDIRSQQTKNLVQNYAEDILNRARPGDFNQALMELGATVCTPSNPKCTSCPLSSACIVYKTMSTSKIPWKSPAKKIPHHQIGVGIIVNNENKLLIALRQENVMLGGLWEFPGGKKMEDETLKQTVLRELNEELGIEVDVMDKFIELKHAYSHFKITLHAYWCRIIQGIPEPAESQEIRWVDISELKDYPFPKANKVITEKLVKDGISL